MKHEPQYCVEDITLADYIDFVREPLGSDPHVHISFRSKLTCQQEVHVPLNISNITQLERKLK